MKHPRALVVEVVVAAPIDVVWNALRDPAAIAQWFGWNDPGLSEEIMFMFATHATADATAHRLTIENDEFTLEARGDQTVVRITRAAPAGGSWDDVYDEIAEGWRTFVHQMRFALEHHAGEQRRTIYLSGRSRAKGAPRPPEAMGLEKLAHASESEAYTVDAATGDRLSGHVWFRSAWQIGLTVDAFGPGLLVAMRRPPTTASPFGGGMFVLTLYGFDEADHVSLATRWRAWFVANWDNVTVRT